MEPGELCCLDQGAGVCCEEPLLISVRGGFQCVVFAVKTGFVEVVAGGSRAARKKDVAVMQNFWCCSDREEMKPPMFFTQQNCQIRSVSFFFFFNYLIKCKDFFKELIKCLCFRSIRRFNFKSTKKGNIWYHVNILSGVICMSKSSAKQRVLFLC